MAPLPLCCVNHISKVVSDVQKSTEFFRDILGFQEVKRPSSFDFGGSWLWGHSMGIHLIEGKPVQRPSEINPKSDHISFQAESLVDVERRLQEMGVRYVKQTILEWGQQVEQVFFHDPDNNMIEVCNCQCLPILPVERAASGFPCACGSPADFDAAAAVANNLHCDSMQESGDEFDPAHSQS